MAFRQLTTSSFSNSPRDRRNFLLGDTRSRTRMEFCSLFRNYICRMLYNKGFTVGFGDETCTMCGQYCRYHFITDENVRRVIHTTIMFVEETLGFYSKILHCFRFMLLFIIEV